jgi:hypothetical protein
MIIALILPMLSSSYALQEVAGPVNLSLKPGDKTSFNWGIVSDSGDTITVTLKAVGDGSQFLSYPSQVTLLPQKIVYVSVNASIPQDYYGKSTFTPFMIATQAGQQGGPTVLNIQVQKLVTVNIVGAPSAPPATSTASPSEAVVPEFPSVATIIFVISTMLILGVAVLSKQRLGLYKIS